jgi:hypothetical protein
MMQNLRHAVAAIVAMRQHFSLSLGRAVTRVEQDMPAQVEAVAT